MGFFSFGRVISAFFNQLFRWLFWNKTGQKILFTIVIAIILFVFIKCGEVAAVEPDNFSSYDQISWDGTIDGGRITNTGYFDYLANNIVYYVELNPFNYYVVTTNTSNRQLRYGFSNSLEFNQQLSNFSFIDMNGSGADFTFSGNNGYKYLLCMVTATASIVPDIYYNAYPYEINAFKYRDLMLKNGDVQDSDGSETITAFPVTQGLSYRLLNANDEAMSVGGTYFVTSLDFVTWRDYPGATATTPAVDYRGSVSYFIINDPQNSFVAPADGYILLRDPSFSNSSYKLFCSSSGVNVIDNNSSVNQNINQSTSAINDVNSSLTDSSISEDDSDYVLPESGVNDIAESGFSNIFDKLRTAFTQESSGQGLVVQVPFTNKSFTISRSTVFGSAELGIVGTLINSFWYFLVSLWIVKDIAHKMNMIKSGNIELAQTSNIKEDLL